MKKLLILTLVATTLICVGCAKHEPEHEWNEFTYLVEPGETLWEIAEEYCPENMDICEYLYEIEQLNDITSELSIGQEITLLTTEECLIDMYDIADIQENDGWYTITLADGNYYEWSKGELR